MKTAQSHVNLVHSYISILSDMILMINQNLSTIIETPSIDLRKHYIVEINLLHFGKISDSVLYLSKIHEMKKDINTLNKMANNLLKDVINYCNRYKIDETEFFEGINEISVVSNINKNALSYNIHEKVNEVPDIESFDDLVKTTDGFMEVYYKLLTKYKQNIEINDFKFPLIIRNNLYSNLVTISHHINLKKITQINDFIRKTHKLEHTAVK